MTKNKVLDTSAFATSGSGAAAQPAKVTALKKTSRSRKATPSAEAPLNEVALSPEAQLESIARTVKPNTPRAKSTAVTHRHKKLEVAAVAAMEPLRGLSIPASIEPTDEDIAALAYSYYVARAYQDANQAEDWFRAVAELRAKLNP